MNKKICFIGYGNIIRTDDGVGPYIVEQLKTRLVGSESDNDDDCNNDDANNENNSFTFITLHQIDLAMAPTLADYDEIIFVDAAVDIDEDFTIETVVPQKQSSAFGTHLNSFPQLMDLAYNLYDASPIGTIVRVHAYDLEFGEELSKKGKQAAKCAIDAIMTHITPINA